MNTKMSKSISKVIGARKRVVMKLLNRVHKFIDEESIRLVDLGDFTSQLKEKRKRVIEAWLPLEQRFEDGETIKNYESISQGMDLFEDQYQDGLCGGFRIIQNSQKYSDGRGDDQRHLT